MSAVVGIRSLAGVASRVCEGCLKDLPAQAFYCRAGRINSTLCKRCTGADNKLRREDPAEHQRVKAARIAARFDEKAKLAASVTAKQCTHCKIEKPMQEFREHRGLYGRSSWCRECERQYTRDWTEENRNAHNERRRETWSRAEFTPEKREAAANRARTWYSENKARHLAACNQWSRNNKQSRNAIQQKRRFKRLGSDATLTPDGWLETLETFNRSCAYCLSSSEELTMDHIVPLSRGGSHTADNVVPACRPCNSKKGPRSIFTMLGV